MAPGEVAGLAWARACLQRASTMRSAPTLVWKCSMGGRAIGRMALIDSKSEFASRVADLGLSEYENKFTEMGIETLASLAYFTDYVPGAGDPANFNKELIVPLLGEEAHPKRSAIRRLFVEAYTLASADLRRKAEPKNEDVVEKLPPAEREARRKALAERLCGISLTGELDPSHRLLDQAHALWEENVVKYLDWSCLTKRDQELTGQKEERLWKPDAAGNIREHRVLDHGSAQLSSDYLLRAALSRRGIALDIAKVMRYETHELWAQVLFSELTRTPIAGIGQVTIPMLHRADVELWRRVAEVCRSGVRPDAEGKLPVDEAVKHLIFDPAIRLLLMPIGGLSPGTSSSGSGSSFASAAAGDKGKKDKDKIRIASLENQVNQLKRARDNAFKNQGGKGTGKNKSRADRRQGGTGNVPEALVGKSVRTAAGDRICYGFNLEGCSLAPPGGKCPKGLHVCAEPHCEQAHGLKDHPARFH